MIKYPRNAWRVLLCDDQVCEVGCRAFCFRLPALMKCLGNSLLYLLRDIVLTSALVSTFMGRSLLP